MKLHEIHPTIYILTNNISENAFEFVCCRNGSWLVSHDFRNIIYLWF